MQSLALLNARAATDSSCAHTHIHNPPCVHLRGRSSLLALANCINALGKMAAPGAKVRGGVCHASSV